jgi:hypothetical protein
VHLSSFRVPAGLSLPDEGAFREAGLLLLVRSEREIITAGFLGPGVQVPAGGRERRVSERFAHRFEIGAAAQGVGPGVIPSKSPASILRTVQVALTPTFLEPTNPRTLGWTSPDEEIEPHAIRRRGIRNESSFTRDS